MPGTTSQLGARTTAANSPHTSPRRSRGTFSQCRPPVMGPGRQLVGADIGRSGPRSLGLVTSGSSWRSRRSTAHDTWVRGSIVSSASLTMRPITTRGYRRVIMPGGRARDRRFAGTPMRRCGRKLSSRRAVIWARICVGRERGGWRRGLLVHLSKWPLLLAMMSFRACAALVEEHRSHDCDAPRRMLLDAPTADGVPGALPAVSDRR